MEYVLVYAMTHNGRFIAHGDICITLAIKSDKLALLDFSGRGSRNECRK